MKQVSERSRLRVAIKFSDYAWANVVPDTVRYRIDCQTTGQQILDWTDASPAAVLTVTVTPDQNAIINDANRYEDKVMAVECNVGTDTQFIDNYTWRVKNLQGYT